MGGGDGSSLPSEPEVNRLRKSEDGVGRLDLLDRPKDGKGCMSIFRSVPPFTGKPDSEGSDLVTQFLPESPFRQDMSEKIVTKML